MPPTTTTTNVQRNNSNWPWLCSYHPGIREKVTNGLNNFARFPFELCGVCIFFICAIPDFISFVFGFFRCVLLIYIFCCHSWLLNWLAITKCPKTNEKKNGWFDKWPRSSAMTCNEFLFSRPRTCISKIVL